MLTEWRLVLNTQAAGVSTTPLWGIVRRSQVRLLAGKLLKGNRQLPKVAVRKLRGGRGRLMPRARVGIRSGGGAYCSGWRATARPVATTLARDGTTIAAVCTVATGRRHSARPHGPGRPLHARRTAPRWRRERSEHSDQNLSCVPAVGKLEFAHELRTRGFLVPEVSASST